MRIAKIQVVCPSGTVTGGPESLHNLAALLCALGEHAEIVYYPFFTYSRTPKEYVNYGVKIGSISDEEETLVVLPEILCFEGRRFRRSAVAIWWLSVDNFREKKYQNWRDNFRYFKKCVIGQRPWRGVRALKEYLHFSKSHYDLTYLQRHKITSFQLTGPINHLFIDKKKRVAPLDYRKNQIIFNPKKGAKTVSRLLSACPDFSFVPLEGLDQDGLLAQYHESKLYIDFGHHPGRERMPRESAVCGCCVVTGSLGSAGNSVDIPIPTKFKLDERSDDFVEKFSSIVNYVFHNFAEATKQFDTYRREIFCEAQQQEKDIKRILEILRSN
jgi:hypothetical protein